MELSHPIPGGWPGNPSFDIDGTLNDNYLQVQASSEAFDQLGRPVDDARDSPCQVTSQASHLRKSRLTLIAGSGSDPPLMQQEGEARMTDRSANDEVQERATAANRQGAVRFQPPSRSGQR